ncbi:hypothetical protein MXL46_21180 [Heyndrickxia sporothermodurans]|uniref:hypothetical protein n=1 Tax=Heyndrickxia sporothermodurans TaxID=46224 RepID=UPI002DB8472E|nr:hypothetical protein [Heyndrickxia sporothermodurans]MEB6551503.1 hypothetical protein [Heyndrickxia sporothermodurans]
MTKTNSESFLDEFIGNKEIFNFKLEFYNVDDNNHENLEEIDAHAELRDILEKSSDYYMQELPIQLEEQIQETSVFDFVSSFNYVYEKWLNEKSLPKITGISENNLRDLFEKIEDIVNKSILEVENEYLYWLKNKGVFTLNTRKSNMKQHIFEEILKSTIREYKEKVIVFNELEYAVAETKTKEKVNKVHLLRDGKTTFCGINVEKSKTLTFKDTPLRIMDISCGNCSYNIENKYIESVFKEEGLVTNQKRDSGYGV